MQRILLESFETDTQKKQKPDEGYEKGFAEGYAAGLSAANSRQESLAHELVQTIADLEFKFDEARGEITQAMGPLFTALAEQVFPQCITDGFAEQIATLLQTTAAQSCPSDISLCIHPQQYDAITTALSATAISVAVTSDASLGLHAARIEHNKRTIQIDCDQLLDDIRNILSSVAFIETRNETHGRPN